MVAVHKDRRAESDTPYPFLNIIRDNKPENFQTALEMAKQRLLAKKPTACAS
jgi:hypothetical protein